MVISGGQGVTGKTFGNRAAAAVANVSTLEDTLSSAIAIHPPAGWGATHFRISGITGGSLFKNNGVTRINNGDFITVAEGQAGAKFLPSANSNVAGSFDVELSKNGTTIPTDTSKATSTIAVTPVGDTPQVANITTLEDTLSGAIVISRHAADGAEVTHFKISGITGGTLVQSDGITAINNGAFITFAEVQAGVKFLPSANSTAEARFEVESSQNGSTVAGQSGKATSTITVTPVNDPPTIGDTANQTSAEDTPKGPIVFTVSDAETAAGSLTVTATSDNQTLIPDANLALGGSGSSRTITLTPTANQFGTATITVTVSDGTATASDTFVLTVTAVNDPPTIGDIGDQTTPEDTATGPIAFTVGDVETPAGSLIVTASSDNQALIPDASLVLGGSGSNRTITLTPAANQFGTATIIVTVSDGTSMASDTFVLTVTAVNDPSTIGDIGDQSTPEDTATGPIAFTVGDVETPAGSLTVTASSDNQTLVPDANLTLAGSGINRTLTVTPVPYGSGMASIRVIVTDDTGATAIDIFQLTVVPIPRALALAVTDVTINESGGVTTAQVRRNGDPAEQLTVTLVSGDLSEAIVPAMVIIPAGQRTTTFEIQAVDDAVDDGDQIVAVSASSPGFLDGVATLVMADDDTAGIKLNPTSGLIATEASGTASFAVVLTAQPVTNVVLNVTSGDTGEATASPDVLTFTPTNWKSPQTVMVAGVDDPDRDGDQVTSVAVAVDADQSDDRFDAVAAQTVSVTTTDNDVGWHNPRDPFDVDDNGQVDAADVLTIINYINAHANDPSLPPPPAAPPPFYDVNNDGLCTAGDVLLVINYVNSHGTAGSGEREGAPRTSASSNTASPGVPGDPAGTPAPDVQSTLVRSVSSGTALELSSGTTIGVEADQRSGLLVPILAKHLASEPTSAPISNAADPRMASRPGRTTALVASQQGQALDAALETWEQEFEDDLLAALAQDIGRSSC